MRIRRAVIAAALVAAGVLSLAGCTSGGGDTFTPPTHGATSHTPSAHRTASPGGSAHSSRQAIAARRHHKLCGGLAEAGNKFAAAERAFYTNTARQNQLAAQAIARELQSVEPVAPGRLKSPMRDMIAAFRTFAAALAHPTARSRTQLAALAQRLAADGKQITGYVTAHCAAN